MTGRRLAAMALLFTCPWLLLACGPMTIKDTATQSYIPIQGWVLELHQDIVIPAERTRVFFQEGRLLPWLNEYKPHCQLRVRLLSEQPQHVQAGRFSIDRVSGRLDEVVSNRRIQLAAAGDFVLADGDGGDGRMFYFYHLGLHSDAQPNVTYLVCAGAADEPALTDYPTLQEIRASLGEYATLELPADGGPH